MQPEDKNTDQQPLAQQSSTAAASPGSVISPETNDSTSAVPTNPSPSPAEQPVAPAQITPVETTNPIPAEPVNAPPSDTVPTTPAEQAPIPAEPMPTPAEANPLTPPIPSQQAGAMPAVPEPKKSRKKIFVIIGSLLALILLVAAFMVFIYIPSKPENVFKTGLNRSGFIVKLISDQASKPENTKKLEKTAFKGTISYTGNDSSLSGTLDAKFNDTNAIAKLTGKYSEKGQPDKNLSVDTISTMDPNNPLPNIFIKIIGIKALQLDELIPGVGDYEGKWLTIDKSVWEKAGVNNEPSVNTKNMLTNEDTAQASKAIVDVTREYVLTANPKKAIFENRKFIGKEKIDGVTAHRYAVGFNKQNTQAYCEQLLKTTYDTKVFAKLTDAKASEIADAKKNSTKDCQNLVKDIKSDTQFEMWVNSSSKLIYKVRLKSKDTPKDYLDIGNTTKGRDQITLFANYYTDSSKSNLKMKLTTDIPSNKTTGTITYSDSSKNNFKASVEFAPYDGKIDTKAPAGAVPASEVIDKILNIQNTNTPLSENLIE